jgi:hypothetical protein
MAVGGICLISAGVVGLAAVNSRGVSRSPERAVSGYLHAVADGRAADALSFAAQLPSMSEGALLTDVVLAQQRRIAHLSGIRVGAIRRTGSTATVHVRYIVGFAGDPQQVDDEVDAVRTAHGWRLNSVAGKQSLVLSQGWSRLSFAGRPLTLDATVSLFPGAVPLEADVATLEVAGHPLTRLADSGKPLPIAAQLTADARAKLVTAFSAALSICLSATSATSQDVHCPQFRDARTIPGTLHGQLASALADKATTVTLSSTTEDAVRISATVSVDASWLQWDFNNQQVTQHRVVAINALAFATFADPSKVSWLDQS